MRTSLNSLRLNCCTPQLVACMSKMLNTLSFLFNGPLPPTRQPLNSPPSLSVALQLSLPCPRQTCSQKQKGFVTGLLLTPTRTHIACRAHKLSREPRRTYNPPPPQTSTTTRFTPRHSHMWGSYQEGRQNQSVLKSKGRVKGKERLMDSLSLPLDLFRNNF